MSLRSQIEAIIYAAEEPVTVDQLAVLLKDEILAQESAQHGEPSADPQSTSEPAQLAGSTEAQTEGIGPIDEATEESSAVEGESDESNETPEGEVLNPKKAQREETKRHKQLIKTVIDELVVEYAGSERGIEIREIASGYRMSTKPEHHDLVRSFAKGTKPPIKLSLPALETLAVIAYKQPVTAPEIGDVRGVDSSGVLASLMQRKLITTAGRKQVIGRPILYKTTKEFLMRFGLKDINELPSMEEFEKLSSQADIFETAVPEDAPPQSERPEGSSSHGNESEEPHKPAQDSEFMEESESQAAPESVVASE